MNEIFQHAIIKAIYFGIFKIKVGRNPKIIENKKPYDTIVYKALELLKAKF